MRKTLIIYKPEFIDLAINLRDNYLAHNVEVDIISEKEQGDIEYARKWQYAEVVFIEDINDVIIHDIDSGYTNRCPISDVFFNDR